MEFLKKQATLMCLNCSCHNIINMSDIINHILICNNCKNKIFSEINSEVIYLIFFELFDYNEYCRQQLELCNGITKPIIHFFEPNELRKHFDPQIIFIQNVFRENNIYNFDNHFNTMLTISAKYSMRIANPYHNLNEYLNRNSIDIAVAGNNYKSITTGAVIGATVGSFIPVVGTFFGGLIGGVLGAKSVEKNLNNEYENLTQDLINYFREYTFELVNYYENNISSQFANLLKTRNRKYKLCNNANH